MGRPRKTEQKRYCLHCGRQLTRKYYRGRLEDMGAFNRRKYCNQACMAAAYAKDTPSYSALLKRAIRFRGNCCEVCGGTHMVSSHHIDGNPANNSPENIQTLCGSCHTSHHHHARRAGLTVPGKAICHE